MYLGSIVSQPVANSVYISEYHNVLREHCIVPFNDYNENGLISAVFQLLKIHFLFNGIKSNILGDSFLLRK